MTTEKNDSEPESNDKSADRRRSLADAIWETPEEDAASLALSKALDDALNSAAGYVARVDRIAVEAEAEGWSEIADTARYFGDRRRKAATSEFHSAAVRLVRLVSLAISTGDTAHVLWAAKRLDERRRREWLNQCRNALAFLFEGRALDDFGRGRRAHAVDALPRLLQWVEPRAGALTPEIVSRLLEGPAETIEAIAGNLACECGAFGYGRGDRKKAKGAFSKLGPEE